MSSVDVKKKDQERVRCCVKNCGKEVPIDKAIKINDQYFCGACGVAYYRSILNF
jgi:hypothetical protein